VQQVIAEFCEAVTATRHVRKHGQPRARYPWKKARFRDVIYTNQDAHIKNGVLILPNGRSGPLRIPLPKERPLPGRLLEVRVCLGRVLLVCESAERRPAQQTTIGVDLGVNSLIAATDGQRAVVISGRQAKAIARQRNKNLAALSSKQAHKTKGSGRWKRLQRRKARTLARHRRRMKDLIHKATRQVAAAFPGATCYIGKPFNDAAHKSNSIWAQMVSQAATATIIQQLDYKTAGAIQIDEAYTSQTCPGCGRRHKCKRTYRCPDCGIVGPRDVVGATNILVVGRTGALQQGVTLPPEVRFVYPVRQQVSRKRPGSRAGTPHVARGARGFGTTTRSPRR
jgi:putative transposase